MRSKLKRICPVFFLLVVSVFVVPGYAFGQSVDDRYCPNPATDFFKGSIYYENGEPWIETIVDPEFEQKVLRGERNIGGDIPLTPVYDLVVRIKPEFNYYCIPGWAGNTSGGVITPDKLPLTVPITGLITIGPQKQSIHLVPNAFTRTVEQDDQGRFIYEWKLKGWPNGIAPPEQLEKLIDAIVKNEYVGISLIITKETSTGKDFSSEKSPVSFNLCAPLWGSGKYKIIGMYSANSVAMDAKVIHLDKVRSEGFAKIEPLITYQGLFSYVVDLKTRILDSSNPGVAIFREQIKMGNNSDPAPYSGVIHNNALLSMIGNSTCGNDGISLLTIPSSYDNGMALLNHASLKGAVVGAGQTPATYVHEFAHTFADLNDEYIYYAALSEEAPVFLTNCTLHPESDYKYNNRFFGAQNQKGCMHHYSNISTIGGGKLYFYRPSNTSIMNSGAPVLSFNVVSCGHMISTIKGGDAHSYFPECSRMNGIIKDGVTAQNFFAPVLSWFNNVVSSPTSLTAQVGSSGATAKTGDSSPYLIVESFDPADPWGGIVQVTSNATSTETAIIDPLGEIFSDFEVASFPIFDPEFFDEIAQEIAALGESEPTLWQKFLNLFSSDNATTTVSEDETSPPAPLVSVPSIRDAHDTIVKSGGNVESGKLVLTGIISVPKDETLSKVKNTFQYASGKGNFVDWVSFAFPEGLKGGDTATDTYTWQAGVGDWRFRLCMDSEENGRTCGEEISVTITGSLSQTSTTTPSCSGPLKLIPATPSLSGVSAGVGKLKSGMMKLGTSITNKTGTSSEATLGRFEYSQNGTYFTPWVNFSVPALSSCAKSSTSYSWEGGEGTWFMRACVGTSTCSTPVKVEIVPAT